jgi:inositol hexakisphosphate/diphosphoinositol-pentakisphosphate kinase
VVTVFRHADRSPKQKMKLVVNDRRILDLFDIFGKGNYNKEIKLKKPKELMKVLEISNKILEENNINEETICDINDHFFNKLLQLKMVLEKNLNFQGMTRKVFQQLLKIDTIKTTQMG